MSIKYKIIEFTDANGNIFYRAKIKRFLFWHYIRYEGRVCMRSIVEHSSYQKMKKYAKTYIEHLNRKIIIHKIVKFKERL